MYIVPVMASMVASMRAGPDAGVMSPYPMVVIVMRLK